MAIGSAFLKAFPIFEYMGKILLFLILAIFPIKHYARKRFNKFISFR